MSTNETSSPSILTWAIGLGVVVGLALTLVALPWLDSSHSPSHQTVSSGDAADAAIQGAFGGQQGAFEFGPGGDDSSLDSSENSGGTAYVDGAAEPGPPPAVPSAAELSNYGFLPVCQPLLEAVPAFTRSRLSDPDSDSVDEFLSLMADRCLLTADAAVQEGSVCAASFRNVPTADVLDSDEGPRAADAYLDDVIESCEDPANTLADRNRDPERDPDGDSDD